MKYKALTNFGTVNVGDIIDTDKTMATEVVIRVSFTDTRFFEPIKTRKFQVEVNEDAVKFFNHFITNDDRWIVTEITEPFWITKYKECYNTEFSVDELYTIDVKEFKDEYQYGNKLGGVKWIKDRFGKGLRESKELADFIFALSV